MSLHPEALLGGLSARAGDLTSSTLGLLTKNTARAKRAALVTIIDGLPLLPEQLAAITSSALGVAEMLFAEASATENPGRLFGAVGLKAH